MNVQEELKQLIENKVIPDVEEAIDEMFEEISDTKNVDAQTKEELEELQDFKADLKDIVKDIDAGDMEDDEASDILNDIKGAIDGTL